MAKSFKWGNAEISANDDLTIADEERIGLIVEKLPDAKFMRAYRFGEFMVGAEIAGEPPLAMVTEDDDSETVQASFDEWRKLSRKFWQQWWAAFSSEDAPAKNE